MFLFLPAIECGSNAGIIPQAEKEAFEVGEVGLVDTAKVVEEKELITEDAILGVVQGNRQFAISIHKHPHPWKEK